MRKPNSAAVGAALAKGRSHDLQGLVDAHELYCNIPDATWRRYDAALQESQHRLRLMHVAIKSETQGNLFTLTWI